MIKKRDERTESLPVPNTEREQSFGEPAKCETLKNGFNQSPACDRTSIYELLSIPMLPISPVILSYQGSVQSVVVDGGRKGNIIV